MNLIGDSFNGGFWSDIQAVGGQLKMMRQQIVFLLLNSPCLVPYNDLLFVVVKLLFCPPSVESLW